MRPPPTFGGGRTASQEPLKSKDGESFVELPIVLGLSALTHGSYGCLNLVQHIPNKAGDVLDEVEGGI